MAGSSNSSGTRPMGALRPITLPSVPPPLAHLAELKAKLARLHHDLASCRALETKLATITDEPVWDATIPFGPLAYFKGQLIHTNDVTVTPPSSVPPSASAPSSSALSSSAPLDSSNHAEGTPIKVLKSAKQAREMASQIRQGIEKQAADLTTEIEKLDEENRKSSSNYPGLEDGWAVNEHGEVLNEEGLPMFDIHEELPPEPDVVPPEEKPAPEATPKQGESKLRYLIKRNGKQVIKPLGPYTPPKSSAPSSPPFEAVAEGAEPLPEVQAPMSATKLELAAFFDQLEKEEAEEAANALKKASDSKSATAMAPTSLSIVEKIESPKVAPPVPTPAQVTAKPRTTMASASKPDSFLSSFGSGFLSKQKPAQKPKPKPAAPSRSPSGPVSVPAATTNPPTQSPSSPLHHPDPPPQRTPLHHILPTPKSIYRPTPPPSAPSSRPNSPRPDRKVSFNVAETPETKPAKQKRASIILPPPPPHDEHSASSSASTAPPPPKEAAKTFQRPIKDTVIERPPKPPSAPKPRLPIVQESGPLATVGRPPRPDPSIQRSAVPVETPSSLAAVPIHTLSLSQKAESGPGEISAYDIPSDSDPDDPSLTSDDDDSDSSNFYGNEDEEDEDDVDIDTALHMREVALEYHRQRMAVGAGAGTGPLGGDAVPETFDAWNQPEVPLDATVRGRVPGTAASSRFRTGRLESAHMIIPSLLASQVREDNSQDSEEDDGISPEDREKIRVSLQRLASGQGLEEPSTSTGKTPPIRKEMPSISKMMGATPQVDFKISPKAPPVVRTAGVAIAVPFNNSPDPTVATGPPIAGANSSPVALSEGKPKKMSRFKARQLGLE